MSPVIITEKLRYAGTVTPLAHFIETTVVEIPAQSDDYIVEGYLDLSFLSTGDTVIVREYMVLDDVKSLLFASVAFSAPVSEPLIRFHTKLIPYNAKYKVTITQTSGTLRQYPYYFVASVLGTV